MFCHKDGIHTQEDYQSKTKNLTRNNARKAVNRNLTLGLYYIHYLKVCKLLPIDPSCNYVTKTSQIRGQLAQDS